MKILITGGHVTPAVALSQELIKNTKTNIFYLGRDNFFEKESITGLGIRYAVFNSGKTSGIFSLHFGRELIKFIVGFFNALKILKEYNPDIIFSFGGYIGLTISIAGFFLKIPVYIHEQTLVPGLSNKIVGMFAKKVFVSFPETIKYFNNKKTLVTGNLIRKDIFNIESSFKINKNKPVVFVCGGSQGSHSINEIIFKNILTLKNKFIIIHQTGNALPFKDFEKALVFKDDNYFPFENILASDIGYVYSISDLVVSRSGANTVFELIALKKPSILIPLPWSANKEQEAHAKFMKNNGVSEIFNQFSKDDVLLNLIDQVLFDKQKYIENFKKMSQFQVNSVEKVVESIPELKNI